MMIFTMLNITLDVYRVGTDHVCVQCVFVSNRFRHIRVRDGKLVTALPRRDENKTGSGWREMGQGPDIAHKCDLKSCFHCQRSQSLQEGPAHNYLFGHWNLSYGLRENSRNSSSESSGIYSYCLMLHQLKLITWLSLGSYRSNRDYSRNEAVYCTSIKVKL